MALTADVLTGDIAALSARLDAYMAMVADLQAENADLKAQCLDLKRQIDNGSPAGLATLRAQIGAVMAKLP